MRILLFGGTSEGRILSEYLEDRGIDTLVSVATEYGEEFIKKGQHISVRTGRLGEKEMETLFPGFDLIIDATHPYALEVSGNIRTAAGLTGSSYLRLIRSGTSAEGSGYPFEAVFDSVREAAQYLKDKEGGIFVSTGAKELEEYTVIPGYKERLVVRVLPVSASEEKCFCLGIKHVIFSKGPFSLEENLKHFHGHDLTYLVTKDGGKMGGLKEKLDAAEKKGIKVVLVRRRKETEGLSLSEIKERISSY